MLSRKPVVRGLKAKKKAEFKKNRRNMENAVQKQKYGKSPQPAPPMKPPRKK